MWFQSLESDIVSSSALASVSDGSASSDWASSSSSLRFLMRTNISSSSFFASVEPGSCSRTVKKSVRVPTVSLSGRSESSYKGEIEAPIRAAASWRLPLRARPRRKRALADFGSKERALLAQSSASSYLRGFSRVINLHGRCGRNSRFKLQICLGHVREAHGSWALDLDGNFPFLNSIAILSLAEVCVPLRK